MLPKVTIQSKVTPQWLELSHLQCRTALRHACNENRPLTRSSLISHSHTQFTVACEKSHFSALSSSRPSAYLLRLIQQCDIATRAKESTNKETAPALADRTMLLASSCCLFGSTVSVTSVPLLK